MVSVRTSNGTTALPNPIRFSSVHVRICGEDEVPSGSNRLARRSWCPSHDRPTLGAAFEEDEDAVDAGDVVGPEKVYQRLILVCALTDLKSMREDDRARRDQADEIEFGVTGAGGAAW